MLIFFLINTQTPPIRESVLISDELGHYIACIYYCYYLNGQCPINYYLL